MTTSRIALIIGGPTSHHDISREVAADILDQSTGLLPVLLTPSAEWRLYPSGLGYSADTPQRVLRHDEILTQLPYLYDAAFITLTGSYARNGQLQRLLDRAGLPYQGSGPRASARVSDTSAVYQVLRRVGFQIPSYLSLTRAEWVVARGRKLRQLLAVMGTQLVVRPNFSTAQESRLTTSPAGLADAIEEASVAHDRLIVQRHLVGLRVRVGVFEAETGIVPGQVVSQSGQTVTPETSLALQRVAMKIHRVLGLRDYSLVELIIAHGRIWVSDVETHPELGQGSAFAASMVALGGSYADLIAHLMGRALSRPEVIELQQSL